MKASEALQIANGSAARRREYLEIIEKIKEAASVGKFELSLESGISAELRSTLAKDGYLIELTMSKLRIVWGFEEQRYKNM